MGSIFDKNYGLWILLLHKISIDVSISSFHRNRAYNLLQTVFMGGVNSSKSNSEFLLKNFHIIVEPFLGKLAKFKASLQQASAQLQTLNFNMAANLQVLQEVLQEQHKKSQESLAVAE